MGYGVVHEYVEVHIFDSPGNLSRETDNNQTKPIFSAHGLIITLSPNSVMKKIEADAAMSYD